MSQPAKPWTQPMPEEQFAFMRDILAAPSPVGLEAAMTFGVLAPFFKDLNPSWGHHTYQGNAGLVVDTHPGRDDMFSVMIIGHADKIRMQVRSIGDDGKIWIESDSFLPATLIGHQVTLFSENPRDPGKYRAIEGGTVEAIGAIHFADAAVRAGDRGIRPNMLYLDLQIWGEKKREQVELLGVRPGDTIILNRPIRRGFSPDTFMGAYLDNGLGCFVAAEVARLVQSHGGLDNVRVQFAFAAYEEIGRMGSRVLALDLKPNVVIAVDVNHDFVAAPGIGDRRLTPLAMGQGFTLSVGAIASESLNSLVQRASRENGIPFQLSVAGRDTGTDAMAAVFASIDAAATSIGFPIRNMHTISETGHTGDVLASVHAIFQTLVAMNSQKVDGNWFRNNHPRLDAVTPLTHGTIAADRKG
jgi:putative aminopeptidase FrvX